MISTDAIINNMFYAIGEKTPATSIKNRYIPSRVEMLAILNQLYQEEIGPLLENLAAFSYDGSDADHTITAGVGGLPSDFLAPHEVYDGDAPDHPPLKQIMNLSDKVADDAECRQYLIPDGSHLWIFGKTPANTVKLYYIQRPAALADSGSSYPTALKPEFHRDGIFEARAKKVRAFRSNDIASFIDLQALEQGCFGEIERAHTIGKRDDTPKVIRNVYFSSQ
ncbi:MAG: hypothetical protein HPY50_04720 [Firmicutes bacterium]|nr:hypothetical protein [Bacillota bacterium]